MDYLEPYLEQLGLLPSADDAAVALSRQQAVKLRDDCLAELKQRLVDQANLIQTAFDKVFTHSLTHLLRHVARRLAATQLTGGAGAGGRGHRPIQIVATPLNIAVLLTRCGQLLLSKISKFDAVRCQILRLKCTKFDFRWGSAPEPSGGA